MTETRCVQIVLTLVLLVALAGCGGSGDDPESAPSTVSISTTTTPASVPARDEFIAAGDAICAEGQLEALELRQRAQELEAQRGTVSDEELLEKAAVVWDDQIALIERYRDRFADLDPPEGEEERLEELVATFDEGADAARAVRDAIDDEDPSPAVVQTYADVVARGNELARTLGFQVCGRS